MRQLNIKQRQSAVQINYSRLHRICHRVVNKKHRQKCQQLWASVNQFQNRWQKCQRKCHQKSRQRKQFWQVNKLDQKSIKEKFWPIRVDYFPPMRFRDFAPIRIEDLTLNRNRPIAIGRKALLISDIISGLSISPSRQSKKSTDDVICGRVQVWWYRGSSIRAHSMSRILSYLKRYKILRTINPDLTEPIRVSHKRMPNTNRIRKERSSVSFKSPEVDQLWPEVDQVTGSGADSTWSENILREW